MLSHGDWLSKAVLANEEKFLQKRKFNFVGSPLHRVLSASFNHKVWESAFNCTRYLDRKMEQIMLFESFGGSHVTFLNALLRGFKSSNHQQYSLQQKYFLLSFQWAATLLQLYREAVLLACWARLVCSAIGHLLMVLLLLPTQPKKQKSSEQILQLCLHMLPPCTDSYLGQPIQIIT